MPRQILLDSLIERAVSDGVFPGACYAVGNAREIFAVGASGRHTYAPDAAPVTLTTLWDLASVSKVIGTTTAAMLLTQEGLLDLGEAVSNSLPEFGAHGKAAITVRNLLQHDSGLVAFRRFQGR